MDTITRNVKDISTNDRLALEHVIGQGLGENQQVIIRVVNLEVTPSRPENAPRAQQAIPAWWNVYEGLEEAEIEQLDQAIRQRANLTRNFD